MLPTRARRVTIAVLLALVLLGEYASVEQTSAAKAVPSSTLWGWVSIIGKCVQEYNGHQYYNECITGQDGRNDQYDLSQCPNGSTNGGCWQGGAQTSYAPYAPYYVYTYVATQESCGSGWVTDSTGGSAPLYNVTYSDAYTGWRNFDCGWDHDEQIYAQHTFVMHNGDPVTSEHTCSKPTTYRSDCA